jgi:hypothetical protein
MMRLLALTAVGVLLCAGPGRSQNPRPEGLPPTQHEATLKDGVLVVIKSFFEERTEKRTQTVKGPDGKPQEKEVEVKVMVSRPGQVKIDPKKASVQRADGKAVSPDELAKLLEKPGMVFLAAGYEKVDPFYLQYLKPDALIVVPERPAVAVPVGPKDPPKEGE